MDPSAELAYGLAGIDASGVRAPPTLVNIPLKLAESDEGDVKERR